MTRHNLRANSFAWRWVCSGIVSPAESGTKTPGAMFFTSRGRPLYRSLCIRQPDAAVKSWKPFLIVMSTTSTKPVPPREPEPQECCGTGCIPCVMDIYEEELWEYERSLKQWRAANPTESESSAQ